MMNLVKSITVSILLFAACTSNAKDFASLRNLKDGKTTILTLENVEQGDLLFIKDLYGQILFEQSVLNSGKFEKGFNLTLLQDGAYYFELKHKSEIKRIPFEVINNKIIYEKNNGEAIANQFKKFKNRNIETSDVSQRRKSKKLNRGIQRNIPSFKGTDFINYYKENK